MPADKLTSSMQQLMYSSHSGRLKMRSISEGRLSVTMQTVMSNAWSLFGTAVLSLLLATESLLRLQASADPDCSMQSEVR